MSAECCKIMPQPETTRNHLMAKMGVIFHNVSCTLILLFHVLFVFCEFGDKSSYSPVMKISEWFLLVMVFSTSLTDGANLCATK